MIPRQQAHPCPGKMKDVVPDLCDPKLDQASRWYVALAALAVMVVVFFSEFLFAGWSFMLRDLVFDGYVRYVFYRECLLDGILPLWNPYTGCGEPYLANIETAVFYPLNLVYLLLPVTTGVAVSVGVHVFLAGAGTWYLCREWGVSGKGSFLAAVAFCFGTLTITKIEFIPALCSVSWYPLVMALYTSWLRKRRLGVLLLMSCVMSLQIFGGWPEAFVYTGLSLGLYALIAGVFFGWKQRKPTAYLAPTLALGVASIFAIILSMAQMLPTLEIMRASTREIVDPQTDMASVNPAMLLTLLFPFAYGVQGYFGKYWAPSCYEYWAGSFYIGVLPIVILFMCLVRLLFGKRHVDGKASSDVVVRLRVPVLATLLVFFLLYAMGKYTPFFQILWHLVPPLQKLRWPAKSLMCVTLALSCLAGIGLDYLVRSAASQWEGRSRWRRITVYWGTFLLCFIASSFVLACLFRHGELGQLVLRRIFNFGSVPEEYAHRVPWNILGRECIKVAIAIMVSAVLLQVLVWGKRFAKIVAWLAPILLFADLMVTNSVILIPSRMDIIQNTGPYIDKLRSEGRQNRFFRYQVTQVLYGEVDENIIQQERESLEGTWPMADRVYSLEPVGDFKSAGIETLKSMISHPELPRANKERVLSMMNCGTVITPGIDMRFFAGMGHGTPRIEDLKTPLPRAYVVGGVKTYPNSQALFHDIAVGYFDPQAVALLEESELPDGGFPGLVPGRVEHTVTRFEDGLNRLDIDVECRDKGLLVVSDAFFAGWNAQVNAKPAPIYKVNGAFRGVLIPAGKSTVTMAYRPNTLWLGLVISLMTLVVICLLLIWDWRPSARAMKVNAEETENDTTS